MALDRLTAVPNTITAGDTVLLTLTLTDFDAADGGTATLVLAGPVVQTWTADANGSDFDFDLAAAETATLTKGAYAWALKIDEAGVVNTVSRGTLSVTPDLADQDDGDLTTDLAYWQNIVSICRTARSNIAVGEMKLYMIDGRQTQLLTLKEVDALEEKAQSKIVMLQSGGQLPPILVGRWGGTSAGGWV